MKLILAFVMKRVLALSLRYSYCVVVMKLVLALSSCAIVLELSLSEFLRCRHEASSSVIVIRHNSRVVAMKRVLALSSRRHSSCVVFITP